MSLLVVVLQSAEHCAEYRPGADAAAHRRRRHPGAHGWQIAAQSVRRRGETWQVRLLAQGDDLLEIEVCKWGRQGTREEDNVKRCATGEHRVKRKINNTKKTAGALAGGNWRG